MLKMDKLAWAPGGNSLQLTHFWATNWLCSHCMVALLQASSIVHEDAGQHVKGNVGGTTWRTVQTKEDNLGGHPPDKVKCQMCDGELLANGTEPFGHLITFHIDTRPKPPQQV